MSLALRLHCISLSILLFDGIEGSEVRLQVLQVPNDLPQVLTARRGVGDLWAIGSKPSHVDSLDAISGRHRALRQGSTTRQKIIQKMDNVTLATRVSESWRRAHKDVAMTIGLNPIRELRKGWIRQDFGPTLEVELGLRNALRQLNGDRRHGRRYARKRKK